MPTSRGITIQLHSQFDVITFPEYFPREQAYYTSRGVSAAVPAAVDDKTCTCSVYVPVLPASQFWLSYSIAPPVPEDQQFLFKLFINGTHITSWSTGRNEGWKGKTMFGLYEREEGQDGKKRIEKRALCFTPPDRTDGEWKDVTNAFDDSAKLEVRVHRASGRKRIGREMEEFAKTPHGMTQARGIDLVNAGRAGGDHPKRFYKFALIDPTDRPFATFRYYYRTWEQLRYLGLLDEDNDVSEIELCEAGVPDPQKKAEGSKKIDVGEPEAVFESDNDGELTSQPRAYRSTSAPGADACPSDGHSRATAPPQFNRFSLPPSLKLNPPEPSSKRLPPIPQKSDSSSSTAYRPHPVYPVEEWIAQTPSPVKSIRDGLSTPPMGRRRGFTPTSLMNVVATAWKRRGTPSSGVSRERDSRNASRNVSDE